jgi:acyl-CoA thioester hydrolase
MNRFPIELRFGDIDMAGHVHNVAYFHFMESARLKFFNSHLPDYNWTEEGFVVGDNYIKYLKSIYLQDKLEVELLCDNIGEKSFRLVYNIYANNNVVSTAYSTMVCMNFKTKKTIQIPIILLKLIKTIEI